jgi:N-methylhydantoinase A
MRFVGQAFEVPVEINNEELEKLDETLLMKLFNDAHHRVFSFGDAGLSKAEIVSFRVGASAPQPQVPPLTFTGQGEGNTNEAAVFDRGEWRDYKILTRSDFKLNEVIEGPLMIEDENATVFVPVGWNALRDKFDNIVIEKGEG